MNLWGLRTELALSLGAALQVGEEQEQERKTARDQCGLEMKDEELQGLGQRCELRFTSEGHTEKESLWIFT